MPRPDHIEGFLASYPREVRDAALGARKLLTQVLPRVAETLDESAKTIGYSYGPGYKGLVCTLILSRAGVKIGIVRGSELPDPDKLLQGSGKVHRHVALKNVDDLKHPGLKPLIEAALGEWRKRSESSG